MGISRELEEFLNEQGYHKLKYIEGRGICGVMGFIFTVAIVHGIDPEMSIYGGYKGRYCYPREYSQDCVIALTTWDGKEDPSGRWIKHKGRKEYTNEEKFEECKKYY